MNCQDWEERVALYAGGDLPTAEAMLVAAHVTECAGCQVLASGLRESLGMLRAAHGEPVGEAHLAAVRARVLSKLERGGRRPWWVWAMAAAAAVALIGVVVRPRPVVVPPVAKVVAPQPKRVEKSLDTAGTSARATIRRKRTPPVETMAAPAESLVVKWITDDPDVIIYWISDSKGD